MRYTTVLNNQQFEVEIQKDGSITINGKPYQADFLELGQSLYSLIQGTRSQEMAIEEKGNNQYDVLFEGHLYETMVLDERAMLLMNRKGGLKMDSGEVHAPMPGLIVAVNVAVGDMVEQGQTVVILESMKMQNELKATRTGKITQVTVTNRQTVDKGALLVAIGDAE